MSDGDDYNVFVPRKALRRTPPTGRPVSRGPSTPARSTPAAITPGRDVSISREESQEPALRSMTSPIREDDSVIQTQPTPITNKVLVSLTPRASTVEPVTPSFSRTRPFSSSVLGHSARRKATTPHAIRGYSNRPTPHKNQGKRRNSRFAAEDDDIFQALKQFSKITAPKSKPFIPTPKAITPTAASSRRHTLEGIRLHRDLNAVLSDDDEPDPIRPPRLSNVSLKLIGKKLTITNTGDVEDEEEVDISPPPVISSPMNVNDDDEERTPGIETPRFEVARRAVADSDRRMSFLPNPFDRFRDFEDVVMDDSIIQQAQEESMDRPFEGESFVNGEMEGLSFADRTADLHQEGDVSNFFDPQAIIPDDETDFRLEQVDISLPQPEGEEGESGLPDITNDNSSLAPGELQGIIDSDFDSDPRFDSALRSANHGDRLRPVSLSDVEEEGEGASMPPGKTRKRKQLPLSVHGIPYPSIPAKVIKSMIARTSRQKVSKEALAMIMEASDAYFENLGEDLGNFAQHAKRKTVEEGDVLQVLRRHRLLNDKTTVFSLANKYLPRELLQDIRIQVPKKNLLSQKRRRVGDDSMAEEEEEEVEEVADE